MRSKRRFYRSDYKIAQPGHFRPLKTIRKIVLVIFLLGGGWFVFDRLLALPSESPSVVRYEVLSIQ